MLSLKKDFLTTRNQTEFLCKPLAIEDYVIQSMTDVSPPKWHLAHTSWFFDQFILKNFQKNYCPFNADYHFIFNSYYQTLGKPYIRERRGLLSRPTVTEILEYRQHINKKVVALLEDSKILEKIKSLVTVGIHHEMQHQELLMMDIKHIFSINPLFPTYDKNFDNRLPHFNEPLTFSVIDGGVVNIGHDGAAFCYDNELPRHKYYLQPYQIANRLITNGEYLEFIEDKGYQQPSLWLSDAWDIIQKQQWKHPLYWHYIDGQWYEMTLSGLKKLDTSQPVRHVSFYEANAFARWSNKRLPTEFEWERAASQLTNVGHLWEWTNSAYQAYPGYQRSHDALGEYNGKFMNNQVVLRGSSFATPKAHCRFTYRNFFQPEKQWQFSGIRLAS